MSRNLMTRIIVAAIFGPLIILISYWGGNWLLGMILLLAALAMIEYMIDTGLTAGSLIFWITLIFIIGIVAISIQVSFIWGFRFFLFYFLLIGMLISLKRRSPDELFTANSSLVWGVAYLGLLYPFTFYIRTVNENSGGDWLLFLFGSLWLSDTLAMLVGKAIGQRKLAPTVSPGKTVAGFVAALFGGIIVALILGYWRLSDVMLGMLIGGGLLVSLVGQLGDLVESVWKRSVGVKDSSSIIPGHGGVLDRFDSLLFAAPVLYWYLKYFVYW